VSTDVRALRPLANDSPVLAHAWHAAAFSEEVGTEPVQAWVAGEPWVLTRLDGRLVAFVDRCPHRLAPISAGRVVAADDGTSRLACGYHGWRYDHTGRCDLIPSQGKTANISRRAVLRPPAALQEAYGLVWLAPEEPASPLPAFPEWEAPGFTTARSAVVRTPVGAAQIVDNFLDAAHFPFVHAASFGVDDGTPLDGGDIVRDGMRIEAAFTTAYRDNGEVLTHTVRKTIGPALTVHLRLDLGRSRIGILLACVPERADLTRVVKLLARDDVHDPGRLASFVKEEDQILAEDLTILERYPHRTLPLDPRVELHTGSDRLSLAWRTLMGELSRAVPAPQPRAW
jgi:vanillate O-demethylase monooxygenase subunit